MSKFTARYVIQTLVFGVILTLLYGVWEVNKTLYRPIKLATPTYTVLVGQGETLTSIVNRLATEGVVRHPRWLLLYARWKNQTHIRAGEYELQKGFTGESLLQTLASGKVIQYQITFVEGNTVADTLKQLAAQKKLIDDLSGLDDEAYKKLLGFARNQAEGWLFPDTYSYVSGMKVSDVLRVAHNRMNTILNEEWKNRAQDLPYKTPYEALIMASIVEKETGVADERKQIAGVFVRRMKKGMKLQTDPTVIYGLGKSFDGNLKRSHLKEYSPWNTYVIDGLPPTPIAMPGRASINAALHPIDSGALFFVARGDGTHTFSTTFEQHQNAINKFQLRRNSNYQSAPPLVNGEPTANAGATP
ncbi:MAG: endolytic transglycosylase MltG [Pseudomonadales bacterium]